MNGIKELEQKKAGSPLVTLIYNPFSYMPGAGFGPATSRL